jgi:catechol 2,3-dioxygenase-like lactoylglutathione lyase family enzyme
MHILSLDHLVLTVNSIEVTTTFYVDILGMEKIVFANRRVALKFGHQKINLHQYGSEFEPKASSVTPGSADLCFLVKQPITEIVAHLKKYHVDIIDGPVIRTGAMGQLNSVYFRDPDGNLIEISNSV